MWEDGGFFGLWRGLLPGLAGIGVFIGVGSFVSRAIRTAFPEDKVRGFVDGRGLGRSLLWRGCHHTSLVTPRHRDP